MHQTPDFAWRTLAATASGGSRNVPMPPPSSATTTTQGPPGPAAPASPSSATGACPEIDCCTMDSGDLARIPGDGPSAVEVAAADLQDRPKPTAPTREKRTPSAAIAFATFALPRRSAAHPMARPVRLALDPRPQGGHAPLARRTAAGGYFSVSGTRQRLRNLDAITVQRLLETVEPLPVSAPGPPPSGPANPARTASSW